MPNHVRNILKFSNLKPKDITFLLNTISIKAEDDSGYWIDFDKIIPEPRLEAECPEDCLVNKDSHVMEDVDRPWFDWYKWHNRYWGTKWNAYDCYSIVGKSCITFVFSTAWSSPFSVINRLCILGYNFKLKYADEDEGVNCGIIEYYDGALINQDEEDMIAERKNPKAFARNVWKY